MTSLRTANRKARRRHDRAANYIGCKAAVDAVNALLAKLRRMAETGPPYPEVPADQRFTWAAITCEDDA